MPQVKLTTTDGDIEIVFRTHPIPSDVDSVRFMNERTPDDYTVESVEEINPDRDLEQAIQDASNLQELKVALTSSDHPAKSRGRGP